MERDDDYLRELLQEYEASDHWVHLTSRVISPSAEEMKKDYHTLLLVDAGLMTAVETSKGAYRITNAGHDFLAVTRQNEVWDKVKDATRHLKGASVQMLFRVAEGYARQKLAELGVPVG